MLLSKDLDVERVTSQRGCHRLREQTGSEDLPKGRVKARCQLGVRKDFRTVGAGHTAGSGYCEKY